MAVPRSDRRRHIRYTVPGKVILIQSSGIHHIRDISLGGLSFHCPHDEVLGGQWPVEIMVAGSLLRVVRLPVRLVRERLEDSAGPAAGNGKEVGVEFVALDRLDRPFLARLLSYVQQTAEPRPCL